MKAHIFNIGDEILIGQINNTNATWMATELALHGITVTEMKVVGDTREAIEQALRASEQAADLVLITGGLGPTKDDITKKTLADYFGLELEYHEPTFRNIESLFAQMGRVADDRYKLQSYMPKGATIFINKTGTASGMWFERAGKVVVSMPGVPREMKFLMETAVLPRLAQQFKLPAILHRTLNTTGKGETDLSEMLHDFETNLPENYKLAYLPNTMEGIVRLRLTAYGQSREAMYHTFNDLFRKMEEILTPKLAYGIEDQPLERVVGALLIEHNQTLATAESCTGGYIGHRMTTIPGSSVYYKGGTVVYSNELKTNLLGVSEATLNEHGAVSEATVQAMVQGTLARMGVDYAIAVSGIAGPDGERPDKPVGTIWVAVGNKDQIVTRRFQFGNDRLRNIQLTATAAMNMLRLLLLS